MGIRARNKETTIKAATSPLPKIDERTARSLDAGEAFDDELDPLATSGVDGSRPPNRHEAQGQALGAARPPNRHEARPPNRYEARPPNRYEARGTAVGARPPNRYEPASAVR